MLSLYEKISLFYFIDCKCTYMVFPKFIPEPQILPLVFYGIFKKNFFLIEDS